MLSLPAPPPPYLESSESCHTILQHHNWKNRYYSVWWKQKQTAAGCPFNKSGYAAGRRHPPPYHGWTSALQLSLHWALLQLSRRHHSPLRCSFWAFSRVLSELEYQMFRYGCFSDLWDLVEPPWKISTKDEMRGHTMKTRWAKWLCRERCGSLVYYIFWTYSEQRYH